MFKTMGTYQDLSKRKTESIYEMTRAQKGKKNLSGGELNPGLQRVWSRDYQMIVTLHDKLAY